VSTPELETLEAEALRDLEAEADQWFEELNAMVKFMREALPIFFRYHRAGLDFAAAQVLDVISYEEMSLGDDCPIAGELSTKLGYDDEDDELSEKLAAAFDDRAPALDTRAGRRAELERILTAHPLENAHVTAAEQR